MCALRDKPRWFMFDGTTRFQKDGRPLHHYLQVAGYATHSVLPEESVVNVMGDVVTAAYVERCEQIADARTPMAPV